MDKENETEGKITLELNGEYIHDFLIRYLLDARDMTEEEKKNRLDDFAKYLKRHPEAIKGHEEPKVELHDYFIEDVKYGVARGGMACGPISGPVIVTAKYNDGEKSQYINCSEFDGFLSFYITDKDIFDYLLGEEDDNEELNDFLQNEELPYFEDICLRDPEYYSIYESIRNSKDYNAAKFIRYILALVNLDYELTDTLVKESINKHISEVFIPKSRTEVWYDERLDKKNEES